MMQRVQARATAPSCVRRARKHAALGFTLIELLVVFTLLALLLTIAVPRYLQAADAAREKVRQQNMATVRDALDKFRADQGRFPNELSELVAKQYLRQIPLDPVSETHAWVAVPHPAGLEPGIYDVGPPADAVSAPSDKTMDQPAGDTPPNAK